MKRNNSGTKTLLIIALICMIGGGMLIGAGFVSGGSLNFLQMSKTTNSWWPFGSVGIQIDNEIVFNESAESWTTSIAKHKKLKIEGNMGDIELRKGDTQEAVFNDISKKYVTIKESGDELEIIIDIPVKFTLTGTEAGTLIVYVTDDQYDVEINNNLGDIRVQDLRFSELDIDCDLGDVVVENVETEKLSIEQNCGDITVSGVLRNKTEIENDLGDIDLNVIGDSALYDYRVENNLGDTRVDGQLSEFNADIRKDTGKTHRLEVTNHLGEIDVTFAQ